VACSAGKQRSGGVELESEGKEKEEQGRDADEWVPCGGERKRERSSWRWARSWAKRKWAKELNGLRRARLG